MLEVGEFSTGEVGNFQPALTHPRPEVDIFLQPLVLLRWRTKIGGSMVGPQPVSTSRRLR